MDVDETSIPEEPRWYSGIEAISGNKCQTGNVGKGFLPFFGCGKVLLLFPAGSHWRHPRLLRVRSREFGNGRITTRMETTSFQWVRCGPEDMKFAIKSGKTFGLEQGPIGECVMTSAFESWHGFEKPSGKRWSEVGQRSNVSSKCIEIGNLRMGMPGMHWFARGALRLGWSKFKDDSMKAGRRLETYDRLEKLQMIFYAPLGCTQRHRCCTNQRATASKCLGSWQCFGCVVDNVQGNECLISWIQRQ